MCDWNIVAPESDKDKALILKEPQKTYWSESHNQIAPWNPRPLSVWNRHYCMAGGISQGGVTCSSVVRETDGTWLGGDWKGHLPVWRRWAAQMPRHLEAQSNKEKTDPWIGREPGRCTGTVHTRYPEGGRTSSTVKTEALGRVRREGAPRLCQWTAVHLIPACKCLTLDFPLM